MLFCAEDDEREVVVATSMQSVSSVRVDQVGSLLRPPALLEARQARQAGKLSDAALTKLEDEAILRR